MLANLYMNRLLKGWKNTKRGEQFQAQIVNYADDFVILSRGKAAEALNWTRQVVTRLELTLNEAKTSIRQARKESFKLSGLHVWPTSQSEDRPSVSGSKSVEEERSAHQGKGGRPARAEPCRAVGGGAGSAQSDAPRLVGILQLRNPDDGISRGRQPRSMNAYGIS